jgi:hypothetical protein
MEEATIVKISEEALKPVSGLINAILEPRLSRIRIWAERKEIQERLSSKMIDSILDEYFKKLLKKVSSITTIVFPQQMILLPNIYEPLILKNETVKNAIDINSEEKEFIFDTKKVKEGSNYLIIDSAGMGKSTFAKHLVIDLFRNTEKLPIYFELRRLEESESLLSRLAKEIDPSANYIDEKVLEMLFSEGDFFIILDGIDEIVENSRLKICNQISELTYKFEKNNFVITSRPEVNLPEIYNGLTLSICPMTISQALSLIRKYDKVADIDVGEKLIHEIEKIPTEYLGTPLLIVLLYKTYGYNQSIATKITCFYDDIYTALYKGHDLTKAGFAREKKSKLDSEDFRRLLRGLSFLMTAKQIVNIKNQSEFIELIDEARKLTTIIPKSSICFVDDLLLAVPLMIKEGLEYRFIHKSIQEYFAAEFISYSHNSDQLLETIINSKSFRVFKNSLILINELNPTSFRCNLIAPYAKKALAFTQFPEFPIIRSMLFLGETYLGIWPFEKYYSKSNTKKRFEIPRPENTNCSMYLLGQIEKEYFVFAMCSNFEYETLLIPAWNEITKNRTVDKSLLKDQDNYDWAKGSIKYEKWYKVDTKEILDIYESPKFQRSLFRMINYLPVYQDEILSNRQNKEFSYRTIDDRACEKILENVKIEQETRNLISKLL